MLDNSKYMYPYTKAENTDMTEALCLTRTEVFNLPFHRESYQSPVIIITDGFPYGKDCYIHVHLRPITLQECKNACEKTIECRLLTIHFNQSN